MKSQSRCVHSKIYFASISICASCLGRLNMPITRNYESEVQSRLTQLSLPVQTQNVAALRQKLLAPSVVKIEGKSVIQFPSTPWQCFCIIPANTPSMCRQWHRSWITMNGTPHQFSQVILMCLERLHTISDALQITCHKQRSYPAPNQNVPTKWTQIEEHLRDLVQNPSPHQ